MSFLRPGYARRLDAYSQGNTPSSFAEFQASVNLSGRRVVRALFNDEIEYADSSEPLLSMNTVGITDTAVTAGNLVRVVTQGIIEEPSWAWAADQLILLGAAGALTQVVPVSGFIQVIGRPLSPTSMQVRIQQPILL